MARSTARRGRGWWDRGGSRSPSRRAKRARRSGCRGSRARRPCRDSASPELRSDIERMPGRERLRPEAERSGLPVTGRPSSSASSTTSLPARHQVTSSPTLISGFFASSRMRAALSMSSLSGRMRIGTSNLAWSQMAALASARSVLVGSDRNTGPQGEVDANFMPRRTVSGIDPWSSPPSTTW